MVKKFIDDADRQHIREAIKQAESRTAGEIVTVIAQESDDYFFIPLLWAALLALFSLGPLQLIAPEFADVYGYLTQVCLFFALGLSFRWQPLKMKLVPSFVKQQRANNNAHLQFYAQGVNKTQDGTGILIFVSVAEQYVEIIADHGIYEKLPRDVWQTIVNDFVARVKKQEIAGGFAQAVQACGELLHQQFPVEPIDINELPNHLIEI